MQEPVSPGDVADAAAAIRGGGPAGRFRIYLGAAAGSGKTTAMLDEGQRLRQGGADVVIAFVECHGRPAAEARIAGLEVVPRQVIEYRGTRLAELDLDGVLRRAPGVALVDELAHTNVPAPGRHDKRWQDVLDLLDAGIDVITTLNIQHLDSVADAVQRITGVPVRERVPEWVVRRADQIELVDASPEQLRARMRRGEIYPLEQVPDALTHFFRAENLIALRALALRFLAGATGPELAGPLASYGVEEPRAERVMAAVTPEPGTEAIIRRAARMAGRIRADVQVVYVASEAASRGREDILENLRQVTADVGATWHELRADDPVAALIDFGRREHITHLSIGSSQRGRFRELMGGGSIVRRISRLAPEAGIDVHIVARREETAP